jgi:hypothetical protein
VPIGARCVGDESRTSLQEDPHVRLGNDESTDRVISNRQRAAKVAFRRGFTKRPEAAACGFQTGIVAGNFVDPLEKLIDLIAEAVENAHGRSCNGLWLDRDRGAKGAIVMLPGRGVELEQARQGPFGEETRQGP